MTVAAVIMATTQQKRKKKGAAEKLELAEGARQAQLEREKEKERRAAMPLILRLGMKLIDVLNSMALQTCLYIIFVVIFQYLANTMRIRQEVSQGALHRCFAGSSQGDAHSATHHPDPFPATCFLLSPLPAVTPHVPHVSDAYAPRIPYHPSPAAVLHGQTCDGSLH